MLSSGANFIIWDKMLSSEANVIIVSSGGNVIIWCYHVMLSSGMITHPFLFFLKTSLTRRREGKGLLNIYPSRPLSRKKRICWCFEPTTEKLFFPGWIFFGRPTLSWHSSSPSLKRQPAPQTSIGCFSHCVSPTNFPEYVRNKLQWFWNVA